MQLRTHDQARRPRPGFTLMEVLVVVAILVVLAGIGIGVFYYLETAKDRIAYAQIRNIEVAIQSYQVNNGSYPQSLEVLLEPEGDKPAPLSQQNIMDPWNREYVYEPQNLHPKTKKPRIYSQGANPGTSRQISNW